MAETPSPPERPMDIATDALHELAQDLLTWLFEEINQRWPTLTESQRVNLAVSICAAIAGAQYTALGEAHG